MEMIWMILCFVLFNLVFPSTKCFMINTNDPYIYYAGKDGFYFGYSLAIHRVLGSFEKARNWLIVGAPLGNDTARGNNPRHGAVYQCDLASSKGKCSVMSNFDNTAVRKGRYPNGTIFDMEIRNGQWLGATVQSVNSYVMACAPRLVNTGYNGDSRWLLGKCQLRDPLENEDDWDWEPCLRSARSSSEFRYCQIGLGASLTPDTKGILSGALGIQRQKGRVCYSNVLGVTSGYTGQRKLDDTDYMGYAVAVGKFTSSKGLAIVGGAPRGNKLHGLVILYKLENGFPILTSLPNPSKQIGSYFGSVLAVADVNGDGFSDLLVGAPFYAKVEDEGAVYVHLNNKKDSLDASPVSLHGDMTPGAMFGFSIAGVGDLNLDGYEDVAIGAPYGGPDGKGAVYIYQGSGKGIVADKYIQRILPSSFGAPGNVLTTFGNSITGGIDVDGNGYPDLAIGSFKSDRAVFLRSRPIVKIIGEIKLSSTKISLTSTKSLCKAPDQKIYKCLDAEICFYHDGKGVPNPIGIKYTYEVDKLNRVADKRAFLFDKGARSFRLTGNITSSARTCITHTAYIYNSTRDLLKPLVFHVSYDYIPPSGCKLCPTMDAFIPRSTLNTATYVKNCGANNICESDLLVHVSPVMPGGRSKIHLGVADTFSLKISVINKGEDAYLSKLSIIYSNDASVVGVQSMSGASLLWDTESINNSYSKVMFSIGNPMSANATKKYEAKFAVANAQPSNEIPFELEATTANTELKPSNNRVKLAIAVVIIADLTISGAATPEQLTYSNTATLKAIGPRLLHTLFVQNKGPSIVEASSVDIRIPRKLKGHFLLNLYAVSVEGSGSCDIDKSLLNPLKLNVTNIDRFGKNQTSNRRRRDVEERLDCTKSTCLNFRCNLGRLGRGDNVIIKLKSTVVEKTFRQNVKKTSTLVVFARVRPVNIQQPSNHLTDQTEIEVTINEPSINRQEKKEEKELPWWVILVSVLAGLILIAGVAFVFYKKGFFNRKKHEKVATQEPMDDDY